MHASPASVVSCRLSHLVTIRAGQCTAAMKENGFTKGANESGPWAGSLGKGALVAMADSGELQSRGHRRAGPKKTFPRTAHRRPFRQVVEQHRGGEVAYDRGAADLMNIVTSFFPLRHWALLPRYEPCFRHARPALIPVTTPRCTDERRLPVNQSRVIRRKRTSPPCRCALYPRVFLPSLGDLSGAAAAPPGVT